MRQCLPEQLRSPAFTAVLKTDETTRRWLAQLLVNVGHASAGMQLMPDVVEPTIVLGQ